jgi:hypothetical protein
LENPPIQLSDPSSTGSSVSIELLTEVSPWSEHDFPPVLICGSGRAAWSSDRAAEVYGLTASPSCCLIHQASADIEASAIEPIFLCPDLPVLGLGWRGRTDTERRLPRLKDISCRCGEPPSTTRRTSALRHNLARTGLARSGKGQIAFIDPQPWCIRSESTEPTDGQLVQHRIRPGQSNGHVFPAPRSGLPASPGFRRPLGWSIGDAL